MAWRRPGDKPLSEPMMVSSLTHICVTRPQWVKHRNFTLQPQCIRHVDGRNLEVDTPELFIKVAESHHQHHCVTWQPTKASRNKLSLAPGGVRLALYTSLCSIKSIILTSAGGTYRIIVTPWRHGNAFLVTGPLWWEPPVTGGFPSQSASNLGIWCFCGFCPTNPSNKQPSCRWPETPEAPVTHWGRVTHISYMCQ